MKVKEWIKNHKIATAGIVIVGLFVIGMMISMVLVSLGGARSKGAYYLSTQNYPSSEGLPISSPLSTGGIDVSSLWGDSSGGGVKMPSESGEEVEVKEGSMEIKSEGAEEDLAEIKSIMENYSGYVERSNKVITNLYIRLNLTLRVPSESFAFLVDELKEKFEVESYNIRNYRIPIGRELDELEILSESLTDYENIREEIKKMGLGKDKIDLLMQLTDKELKLKEKERIYQGMLSSKEKQGELATLNVGLEQKKSPTVWPEDISDQFKDRLRRALDNTIKTLKDLVGGSIEIFFKAIQIVIYIFIIGVILAVFYRLTRGLFGWLIRKKRTSRENTEQRENTPRV